MDLLFYDFETYYDREYSLRKMSSAEYILDPRFEALGCGFKRPGEKGFWVDKPDLPAFFSSVPWATTYAVAHNALFDACILAWQYGVHPRMRGDTIAMARNWWWHETGSASLADLAKFCGLPPKMDTLHRTWAKSFEAITYDKSLLDELRTYGADDAAKCERFFTQMIEEGFPTEQLKVIDLQIKMCTQPQFVVDQELLAEYHGEILAQKSELLAKVGMTLEDKTGLMSNDQLALLLLAHGVIPPKKVSKTTGLETWAFAKTDEEFEELLEHEDPMVQAIVAARFGVKTTIEETRTLRFMTIGNLAWPSGQQSMPVALKYSGTHTHRFSGDWKLNQQNLGKTSPLRKAIKAPAGRKVVSVDASQIEARILAGFARTIAIERGHPFSTLVQQFALGEDIYSKFASTIFGHHVNQIEHPDERFVGKQGILSLGYSSSWVVFQNMVRIKSEGKQTVSDVIAMKTVESYRKEFSEIPLLWSEAEQLIFFMAQCGEDEWKQFGPVWLGRGVMVLPNGNRINYRNLRQELDTKTGRYRWWYDYGRRRKMLYGAKLIENAVQALAFVLIIDAALRIEKLTGGLLPLAHQVHDELIYVPLEHQAEAVKELVKREMCRKPAWMPWLPLNAGGGIGDSYGNAKG
jgi:DNA polymerase I-like protein with 3'-5' exonuclease and polymerase domains